MNLESLANELLLDIFQYLSSANLLHAFYNLKNRFNSLLLRHFQNYDLDFQSISKDDFNTMCRHLLFISNQVTSVHLSDKHNTPGQIDQFCSFGFTLHQFVYLQSLSIYHLHSEDIMNTLLLSLPHLSLISDITFKECSFSYDETNSQTFVNILWNLPKLINCHLDIQLKPQTHFPVSTVLSSTIESLFITDINPQNSQLALLFKNTPHLRNLSIDFHLNFSNEPPVLITTSIITLNVSFFTIEDQILVNLFQIMPNLLQLTIDLPDTYIDGQIWERIIEKYLPQLKIFQFRMNDELDDDDDDKDEKEEINERVNHFQSSFWLDKYQLVVRCDYNLLSHNMIIYSLPYAFDNFYFQYPILSISTQSNDDNVSSSYNQVHRLTCKTNLSNKSSISSIIQFTQIRELCIHLPINNYFWNIIPRLERIKILDILISNEYNENYEIQLKTLFDKISNVSIVRFRNWSSINLPISPIQKISLSLSQLDLMWYKWYNLEKCTLLTQMLINTSCKILLIDVKNRKCILKIINTMNNLQSLHVRCQDDTFNHNIISAKDELIEWVQQYIPISYTITRDNYPINCIRLWIS
ncbi:unnamed protein product [Adineta steineri]|uniref:F-box domain-containing protein n=1 Tax=Adineta steineri TaxID=433720 RepID=A0A819LVM6_9BILA|nr:unnamed protein product [Adineta steineri]